MKRTLSRHLAAATAVASCLLAMTSVANAQLTQDEIDSALQGLSGTPQEVRSARQKLLEPLDDAGVRERREFVQLVRPRLLELVQSENETAAINAMLVMGKLAETSVAQDLALELRNGEASAARRYAAATALAATFEVFRDGRAAIPPQQATNIVRRLEEALRTEQDLVVLDGIVKVYASLLRVPNAQAAGLRQSSAEQLARILEARLAAIWKLKPAPTVLLRTAFVLRVALTNEEMTGPSEEPKLTPQSARVIKRFADALLASSEAGGPPELKDRLDSTAAIARTLQFFAEDRMDSGGG